MLSRILTLHISKPSIQGHKLHKCTLSFFLVEKKYSRISNVSYWQKKLSLFDPKTELADSIRSELEKRKLEYECVVVSFLPEKYFLRNFSFPFFDRNKIDKILQQELEDNLPFPLDEFYFDFLPTGNRTEQGYEILVLGINKKEMDDFYHLLSSIITNTSSPPQHFLIDLPYAPLFTLCSYICEPELEKYLFIHFEENCLIFLGMEKNILLSCGEIFCQLEDTAESYHALLAQIKSIILQIENQTGDFNIEQIILSGKYLNKLSNYLEQKLSITVRGLEQVKFSH
jgi:Tfp pilus assembly PilM family ATPase